MSVTMTCADLGLECPGKFTTTTDDELLAHVALHAEKAHPDIELNDELVEKVKSLVRQT